MSRLKFESGGLQLQFVALDNFRKLLFGTEQKVLFGTTSAPSLIGWLLFGAVVLALMVWVVRLLREARTVRPVSGAWSIHRSGDAGVSRGQHAVLAHGSARHAGRYHAVCRGRHHIAVFDWAWVGVVVRTTVGRGGGSSAWCFCCR